MYLSAVILYISVIASHGYIYGHQDMMEIVPYVKFLLDPDLYTQDFYVQQISQHVPNERIGFVTLLSWFGWPNPWVYWILHGIISMVLICGMLKVAFHYLSDAWLSFLTVLFCLTLLYHINLGGNELYYNALIPSLLAKSTGIWSLYLFLSNKKAVSLLLLFPILFIQPLVGLQLFILLVGSWVLDRKKAILANKTILSATCFFALCAGVWIFFLRQGAMVPPEAYFDIIQFRLSHHFIPSAFGVRNYAIIVPLVCLGWLFFVMKKDTLRHFFLIAILGAVLYAFGAQVLMDEMIISSQWFKTTIWLEFLSIIAVMVIVKDFILIRFKYRVTQWVDRSGSHIVFVFLFHEICNRPYSTCVHHGFTLGVVRTTIN